MTSIYEPFRLLSLGFIENQRQEHKGMGEYNRRKANSIGFKNATLEEMAFDEIQNPSRQH